MNQRSLLLCCVAASSIFLSISLVLFIGIQRVHHPSGGGGTKGSTPTPGRALPLGALLKDKKVGEFQVKGLGEWKREDDSTIALGLKKNAIGGSSGGAFDIESKSFFPRSAITFSYKLFLPDDFVFGKGGKLPGVCLSPKNNLTKCANASNWLSDAGSVRLMWRDDAIIGYIYLPGAGPEETYKYQGEKYKKATIPGERAGHDVFYEKRKSVLKLQKGWNDISMTVKLNDPSQKNGVLTVTVNGKTRSVDDIMYRKTSDTVISRVRVVAFRGGGSMDWSVPRQNTVKIKDLAIG